MQSNEEKPLEKVLSKPRGYLYFNGDGEQVKSYLCDFCIHLPLNEPDEIDKHMEHCKCADCEGCVAKPYFFLSDLDQARLAGREEGRADNILAIEECLSFIPRKMKNKKEEQISSEGYEHGIKTAIDTLKEGGKPAFATIKEIQDAAKHSQLEEDIKKVEALIHKHTDGNIYIEEGKVGVLDGIQKALQALQKKAKKR